MPANDAFEELFSSRGRVKVLKELLERGEVNITQLIKLTGLNYVTTTKHLKYLVKVGIVEEIRMGRVRIYRPNWMDPRVRMLEEVIKDLSE